ncbi:secondary thiamine-phosphate synthase enzyme YjbQ [Pontivivens insulae]|uniref:Secondary thiamine-phosphate synthase enzyme n=1 Tax=Pontivivens insulae TaxID=1639689 RepID=A0A2R8ABP3_9RHOB|nr:secondary thiamine-phosphate synthase enzyme YjbQ [Pontivivens insulae]RED11167.1 secondary thiamine-phosphate synthase enzyme [Pontivivens insulae]SPF29659.1 hypothetical protein POI8812_01975 [Pontivivens insulae]
MLDTISIRTSGPGLYEITDRISVLLPRQDGLLTALVRHTSCSLLIQENADPDVQVDLRRYFERLVPRGDTPDMAWLTHVMEGPDDMPAHIKAAMLPVSLGIPVAAGRMMLGTWQGIYLFEHRERPHTREIALHFRGD